MAAVDLEKVREYALSNDDINQILSPDTNIISYPELTRYATIDDVFDELGRVILLYLTESENVGHWVCMWRDGRTIQYFDPYGNKPEEPKSWLSKGQNIRYGQAGNYLTDMLRQSGRPVFYNTKDYQKEHNDINTCGRHVVARLLLKDLPAKQYDEIIEDAGVSPDDFVSLLTYFLLGK